MGGWLGFCDDGRRRALAAVWGAGQTQALRRWGPRLRSLGPQSRTRKQRPGAPGGAFQLLFCENDDHSCRPGLSCEWPPLRRGRGGGLGLEPRGQGGLQMQVDGVGWGGGGGPSRKAADPSGSSARTGAAGPGRRSCRPGCGGPGCLSGSGSPPLVWRRAHQGRPSGWSVSGLGLVLVLAVVPWSGAFPPPLQGPGV